MVEYIQEERDLYKQLGINNGLINCYYSGFHWVQLRDIDIINVRLGKAARVITV